MTIRGLIIVTGNQSEAEQAEILDAAPGYEVLFTPRLADAGDKIGSAVAIAGTLSGSELQAATNLKWVHSWAAGANSDLVPEMITSPVTLTSSVGNGAVPLAEHSMLLMMMLNRNVPRWAKAQADHVWDRFTHGELKGTTVGIVGLGHAGADLALKARAFHMKVLGVRRRAHLPVEGVDRIFAPEDLREMLPECDFVVVTAPITPGTESMFGEAEFKAMKQDSFFVCISRGGIADDEALLTALKEGWIAGAGLDAHGVEPLPAESPFWDLPNVIVTPHNGATTPGTARRGIDIFLDNLRRFVAEEPLTNLVDKSAGY
ncbi:D-2-hydroxyacid dehydrogenase [Paenarthrobacter ureafaciens]|uniref:D-2-hydroxyacid dehydrogenase n=1 Tax=Paenarthrobacter ureafaciens TaxID=37931 RepID=UPI002DBD11F0|nr:D-2-hydroxyacid dehydrogenase [Paenarthrobacter ureafaciens]MEC3853145.1 D-2-hydroxyacid dehydrogenase [Paenarthrobacter ureafaciens]